MSENSIDQITKIYMVETSSLFLLKLQLYLRNKTTQSDPIVFTEAKVEQGTDEIPQL